MQVTEYTEKIERLLISEDKANVALAFQLMEGQGIPESLYPLMGDDFYKKTLCLQHGIMPPIQDLITFHLEGDHQQPPRYLLAGNFGKLFSPIIFLEKVGDFSFFFDNCIINSLIIMELSNYLTSLLSFYKDKRVKKHFTFVYFTGFMEAFKII